MRTSKKQLKKEVIEMIEKMEQNTFLFPTSWSDDITMIEEDWKYRSYNSGSIGSGRYHNFNIKEDEIKIIDIKFRGDQIYTEQDLAEKQVTMKDVHYYIKMIFDEMHSFKNHSAGKRAIRKEIDSNLKSIKELENKIKISRQRLIDFKKGI